MEGREGGGDEVEGEDWEYYFDGGRWEGGRGALDAVVTLRHDDTRNDDGRAWIVIH